MVLSGAQEKAQTHIFDRLRLPRLLAVYCHQPVKWPVLAAEPGQSNPQHAHLGSLAAALTQHHGKKAGRQGSSTLERVLAMLTAAVL